jgi:hypothetical protein
MHGLGCNTIMYNYLFSCVLLPFVELYILRIIYGTNNFTTKISFNTLVW